MKKEYVVGSSTVEVGRMRDDIWKSLDRQGVSRSGGVVPFFACQGFERPKERQDIELIYTTPGKLGFTEPSNLDLIWKEIGMRRMSLDECPMETAVSLLDELADKTGTAREYYVVSTRRKVGTGEIEVPEFLKIALRQGGTAEVLGWSTADLIPLNGVLVFKQGLPRI